MSLNGSSGQARSISSIREDTGSNIDRVLDLGRMLAAHLENHDTTGHWVAHHLAELVVAAEDESTTTVEQRLQIVQTVLKVWSRRRDLPRRSPLQEFSGVLAGLDRLGDRTSWRFLRLAEMITGLPDPSSSGLPLVETAAELERLARETLLHLFWLAAQDAKEANQEWLAVADEVAPNIETQVHTRLARLRGRLTREDQVDQPDQEDDPLSTANHVKRLRAMAELLNRVADDLAASDISNSTTSAPS
ncbi:hypothetical protein [Lentzea sp. NPDC059081]|uniref:hypothetical protein n=1 Tax=Lentzea sp. NPDC059081 TaxID=3346719 RepID=UPI0036749D09